MASLPHFNNTKASLIQNGPIYRNLFECAFYDVNYKLIQQPDLYNITITDNIINLKLHSNNMVNPSELLKYEKVYLYYAEFKKTGVIINHYMNLGKILSFEMKTTNDYSLQELELTFSVNESEKLEVPLYDYINIIIRNKKLSKICLNKSLK